jgi:hypothetical protein
VFLYFLFHLGQKKGNLHWGCKIQHSTVDIMWCAFISG